ncbi:pre-mRNA-splicing factor ATP-dependent RNA helicase DHX16 [Dendrobium catenatum]|uniref:Pre-mRNA-splicing factor ATP-dependent RNA helicase DHX16 n=1 Tax=Dendrobium catenatum TaxID=906689 RepID=A0A2I0XJE7_9ASPA|nr:pre-mRNA-splicing factor ATP-dependent RNA helicase DHX16 [Dendrobium catenatum]
MADPELEWGLVFDVDGNLNILRSPFFDVGFEDDTTFGEYLDRVVPTLASIIDRQLPNYDWSIDSQPFPPSSPPSTFPCLKAVGVATVLVASLAKESSSPTELVGKLVEYGLSSSKDTRLFAEEIFAKVPHKPSGLSSYLKEEREAIQLAKKQLSYKLLDSDDEDDRDDQASMGGASHASTKGNDHRKRFRKSHGSHGDDDDEAIELDKERQVRSRLSPENYDLEEFKMGEAVGEGAAGLASGRLAGGRPAVGRQEGNRRRLSWPAEDGGWVAGGFELLGVGGGKSKGKRKRWNFQGLDDYRFTNLACLHVDFPQD